MNLMYAVLTNEFKTKDERLNTKIKHLKQRLKESGIKIEEKFTKLGETSYYYNGLPYVSGARDVLKKPEGVCKMYVNWKKKNFTDASSDEIMKTLKEQWGWNITTVDADHSRNKFKNKNICWAVFDTEEKAKKSMSLFNALFMTAIEQDAIEEYKKFKENPEKRPLTFDKLVSNYAELYEAVDKGEL